MFCLHVIIILIATLTCPSPFTCHHFDCNFHPHLPQTFTCPHFNCNFHPHLPPYSWQYWQPCPCGFPSWQMLGTGLKKPHLMLLGTLRGCHSICVQSVVGPKHSFTSAKCFKCCVDFCDNLTVFDPASTVWLTGHEIPISNCTGICVHAWITENECVCVCVCEFTFLNCYCHDVWREAWKEREKNKRAFGW